MHIYSVQKKLDKKVQFSVPNYQKNMIMKSILTISCFVVMALANQTEDRNISPVRLNFLREDMNATCFNLTVIATWLTQRPRKVPDYTFNYMMGTTIQKYMGAYTFAPKQAKNGNCRIVKEIVFETNCNKAAYQDTFCQVNRVLLHCKGYDSKIFSGILPENNANCTLKRSRITLKDFCSRVIVYLESLYRECSFKKQKRALFNMA